MCGNCATASSVRHAAPGRSRMRRRQCASALEFTVPPSVAYKAKGSQKGCLGFTLRIFPKPRLGTGAPSCRRLLGGRGSLLGEQSSLLHGHNKWARRVRDRRALEIKRGSVLRHQLGRDSPRHGQYDIGSLLVDIVLAGGNLQLCVGSLYDLTLHLQRHTLDSLPDLIIVLSLT